MKRYSTALNAYDHICFIEDSDGEWVRYDDAQAELATLRARCERQDGDPTVEQLRLLADEDWVEPNDAMGHCHMVTARALLRAWGDPDPRGLKETLERLP